MTDQRITTEEAERIAEALITVAEALELINWPEADDVESSAAALRSLAAERDALVAEKEAQAAWLRGLSSTGLGNR